MEEFLTALTIVVGILLVLVVLLGFAVLKLYGRQEDTKDEIAGMRYIKVKQKDDGSWELTSKDGKSIFEL